LELQVRSGKRVKPGYFEQQGIRFALSKDSVYQKANRFIAIEFNGKLAGKVPREKVPAADNPLKPAITTYRDHQHRSVACEDRSNFRDGRRGGYRCDRTHYIRE